MPHGRVKSNKIPTQKYLTKIFITWFMTWYTKERGGSTSVYTFRRKQAEDTQNIHTIVDVSHPLFISLLDA